MASIGNRDDLCNLQNMLPFQPGWISRAVEPFMVLQDDLSNGPWKLYIFNNFES
jgi:hypothetical protein